MSVSLANLDARISTKKRKVAGLIEQRESAINAIDTLEGAILALESKESLAEAENAELEAKVAQYKADRSALNKLSDKIEATRSDVRELEADRAMRQSHNAATQELNGSAGRETPHDNLNADLGGNIRFSGATNEQQDHDISSFFRNSYMAKYGNTSLVAVCNGALGDQYKNTRLGAAVLKSANPAMFPDNYIPRLIELLRPRTVVRKMKGLRNLPLINGNLRIPRQSSGSTANYAGEMTNLPTSDVGTDQITFAEKKLTVMVVESGEIMRQAGPSSDALIRDDVTLQLAIKEDSTFLRATGSATIPKGLKAFADTASHNLSSTTPLVAATVANATRDLGVLMLKLKQANVGMIAPVFIMAPRTEQWLMDVRDGNGNYAFPEMQRGLLRGLPYLVSNQIPVNLSISSSTVASEIYLVDASDYIIADAPTFDLSVSLEAAYHDGVNVQAAFSQDAAVFRLIVGHDTGMRHNESVAYLKDVTWGGV